MSQRPLIELICGGTSEEREVSLRSGKGVSQALAECGYEVRIWDLLEDALPSDLLATPGICFPMLHGTFGEDGEVQRLMEEAGLIYAGSDAVASTLCFDKEATLLRVEQSGGGVPTARRQIFDPAGGVWSDPEAIGYPVILKPSCQGSSVGLTLIQNRAEWDEFRESKPESGKWLMEEYLSGREFSVGVLEGEVLGVVEIRPIGGLYDYEHKYTVGATEYLVPAPLEPEETALCRKLAGVACQLCGIRDFARVDFRERVAGEPVFLEINTLPGMTSTSLLPKSASVEGLDYTGLVGRMVSPAVQRWQERRVVLSHGA